VALWCVLFFERFEMIGGFSVSFVQAIQWSAVAVTAAFFHSDDITNKAGHTTGKRDRAWIDQRVEQWQPTASERAFDRIAWAPNLREALRLGKEHARPVFLFTYDGESLACYRC
jgi:hypothetical protein